MKIFLAILMITVATPVMAGHTYSHPSYNQDNEDLQRRKDDLERRYIRERTLRSREQDYSPGRAPNLGGGERSYPGESLLNERKPKCRSPLCD